MTTNAPKKTKPPAAAERRVSLAQKVFRRLDADAYLLQAIRLGVANYSAVAAKLRSEHFPSASLEAIKAAVRRKALTEEEDAATQSRALANLITRTRAQLRSNMAVITLYPRTPVNPDKLSRLLSSEFLFINSANAILLVFDQEYIDEVVALVGKPNIISKFKNACQLSLVSPREIEKTPGFVSYICDLLARNGVNIREYYSCYTDTIFLLDRKDALKAYQLLDEVLQK